ncbi:PREDICTED: chordin, partial [Tauraco erythrolophus]|uniref:chordin n=1 Tax=Tauraco erythrolophus TaxID=121530 RepID=UPI000523CE34
MPALPGPPEKSPAPPFDTFEYFQDKEDDLDKPYNDRSYLSSEGLARDDARTALHWQGERFGDGGDVLGVQPGRAARDFGIPTVPAQPHPFASRLGRPSRVRFSDPEGNVLFEHPVQKSAAPEDGMANIQLLRGEQLRVSLITRAQPSGEVHGHILKHRALFAETFGAILTSSDPTHLGAGGMAMLTLSDTENNLHFILMARGLLEPKSSWVPLRVRILHQGQMLREVRTNITMETITTRRSCDTIQSVLCGADALLPTKTGAVGSAKLALHENGTLEYQ